MHTCRQAAGREIYVVNHNGAPPRLHDSEQRVHESRLTTARAASDTDLRISKSVRQRPKGIRCTISNIPALRRV